MALDRLFAAVFASLDFLVVLQSVAERDTAKFVRVCRPILGFLYEFVALILLLLDILHRVLVEVDAIVGTGLIFCAHVFGAIPDMIDSV